MSGTIESTPQRAVAIWLLGCAGLVYTILIIGGITRLTHSGPSIAEWKPLMRGSETASFASRSPQTH